ncbi:MULTISPECIES: hypothetical protein [Rhodococcus]|uniref:Uncharacterized protein n=1 Tax=Rhodococcus oxybenzonivorans TaxID=1990687 RepID=A0AAE4UX85_9NOCA|nr:MULTISPECIES: hypothetical protein [Rhodococcus]MDV7241699.1 hypothetical protein [Rhodococcus oxybenzonivorans]MDV7264690.1 hypothetical protein [Rhodococcus oxybenzonivorans]MDV7273767.1 hypothetical protein [Rhodococcus oxybenzonivorans]MDV7333981.1 hypothetical protein [Rhodococcus oxybenzonivorans]MDV7343400.1 hypothetical protein [Rhodococcus oxybenzonivorans]
MKLAPIGGALMPPPGVGRPPLPDVPAAGSWDSYFYPPPDHRTLRNLFDEHEVDQIVANRLVQQLPDAGPGQRLGCSFYCGFCFDQNLLCDRQGVVDPTGETDCFQAKFVQLSGQLRFEHPSRGRRSHSPWLDQARLVHAEHAKGGPDQVIHGRADPSRM